MAAQREKGLCYNCDARFTPGHRCSTPQFLCLMIDDDEDPPMKIINEFPDGVEAEAAVDEQTRPPTHQVFLSTHSPGRLFRRR